MAKVKVIMTRNVLYIHPIKQGLKLKIRKCRKGVSKCSLHTSNKTRIETFVSTTFDKVYPEFFTYIQ